MTTSDFIKMLKEPDPSGTAHIRMSGGIPISVDHKEGYWDGPYTYINENGDYVYSIEGSKVDIYTIDISDFIERHMDINNPNNWEDIKNKIKIKYDNYGNSKLKNERIESIMNNIKKEYDEWFEILKK